MNTILLATNNHGKLIEIQAILSDADLHLVTPREIGLQLEVEEDGLTYAENAAKKALAFAAVSGLPVLADDSGLEVDALNGAPGLHSARFSPRPGATDADRRHLLVSRLAGAPRPWTARFRCVIAIAAPGRAPLFSEGVCPGEIIPQERGQGGFGYDPIFYLPELSRTMAELESSEKNRISHRGRAIAAARPNIFEILSHSS
jgi:XTP/dITP diphosphohydrolase